MAEDVLEAFCARKAAIDAALAEIAEHSEDHFGIDPDGINWGHVGDLADIGKSLNDIADRLAGQGEYTSWQNQAAQTGA
jgi:hypothetical protein